MAKTDVPDNSVSYKEYKEMKSKTVNEAKAHPKLIRKDDPTLMPVNKTKPKDDFGFITIGKDDTQKKKANVE